MDYNINNTSEITLDELYSLEKQGIQNINIKSDDVYNIYTFKLIKIKLLEYIQNIPQISMDDPDREKKIFTYLYIKIAQNISYDEEAADFSSYTGYEREMTIDRVYEASNLIGGLLNGKSICKGYSTILKNLLSEVGINTVIINGGGKTRGDHMPSHSWNQVFLDGKWYNCDITNDTDFINARLKLPFFLKSNKDFGNNINNRYSLYPPKNPDIIQFADTTVTDEQQEKLIEEQIHNIQENEKTDIPEKPKSFLTVLKDFFMRKLNKSISEEDIKKLKNERGEYR